MVGGSVRQAIVGLATVLMAGTAIFGICAGHDAMKRQDGWKHDVSGNVETWHIDRPPITVPLTKYSFIRFLPGDTINLRAGGCVNTHGSGDTTKRYVDPLGPNSDRLYSGMIDIPGITGGLVRIGSLVNRTLYLPRFRTHRNFVSTLTIGYQDDDYSDNDYDHFDHGNPVQCVNAPPAWITITVTHNTRPSLAASAPLDLVSNEVDDNFIPLNPKWGYQQQTGNLPDLRKLGNDVHDEDDHLRLGQPPTMGTFASPTVDEAHLPKSAICAVDHHSGTVHGHINWEEATYTGLIYFHDFQNPPLNDNDLDLELLTPSNAGASRYSDFIVGSRGPALDLEFNRSETTENFLKISWWRKFDADAQNQKAGLDIDGHRAIAIGLMGVDNQHNGHSELHPVHLLFMNVDENATTERWAFFVRTWGDEGFCSQDQHFWGGGGGSENEYYVFLPGCANPDTTAFANRSNCSISYQQFPDGLLVRLNLPDWQSFPEIYGFMHTTRMPGQPFTKPPNLTIHASRADTDSESYGAIVKHLTSTERTKLMQALSNAEPKSAADTFQLIGSQSWTSNRNMDWLTWPERESDLVEAAAIEHDLRQEPSVPHHK